MYSNIAVTNKHTAKLHHVGSLYVFLELLCGALSAEAIDLGRPYWILHPVSCHKP